MKTPPKALSAHARQPSAPGRGQAPWRRGSQSALLALVLAVCTACAHAGAHAPSAATPVPAPASPAKAGGSGHASPSDAAVADGRAPGPLSLGTFEVQLPSCPTEASSEEASFCASATRAVRAAYEDDDEDPSRLLALNNALEVRPELAQLAPSWRGPLGHALARSEGLQRIGPTLRLLRRAVADAYLDQVSRIYRGVNTEACRAAFAQLPADEPHWLEMVVTVEPLGTYPLSRLRRFCLDSRTLARAERRLLGQPAAGALRQAVRAAWQHEHLQALGQPVQVRTLGPWHVDATTQYATRQLAVGAERRPEVGDLADAYGVERCHVERLVLVRRGPHATPTLGRLAEDGPIACRRLHPNGKAVRHLAPRHRAHRAHRGSL